MTAYYNEFDPKAAAWLRELIKAGHIAPGEVDERSIKEVRPDELKRFTQLHLFAGIGGWSLALRLAGWPDDQPVWTGSCPCQPFSSAGNRKGTADDRHLWPSMFALIKECAPLVVFGEQVASAIGHGWLDGVCADLEEELYAVGAVVLGAHSVGAPHIRQRMFWVADRNGEGFAHTQGGPRPAWQDWWNVSPSHAVGGAQRRIPKPGFRIVVDGLSAMPHAVRGYGNAIVPQVAAEFIGAYLEAREIT